MALSQIIVTSRYLKSGNQKSKNKRRNYTKYIAIRETVEMREQNTIDRNNNATQNQQELFSDLLSDFPEAKRYLEYEDFKANPTVENASELISTIIERNADVIGNRQNFVGYMAMRPGVEKRGAHGLLMKVMNRLCLTEPQMKLQIIPETCGRTLSLCAVRMRFVLAMITPSDGVNWSCGTLLTLRSRRKFRCAI